MKKIHLYKAPLHDRVAGTNLQIKPPVHQVHRGKKELKTSYFFQLAKKYGYLFFSLLFILWATPRGT